MTQRRSNKPTEYNHDISAMVYGKMLPQAVPIEEIVLGSLLIDKDSFFIVAEILRAASFYKPAHAIIFEAMLRLFEKSEPIDIVTVYESLNKSGQLETIGGIGYLVDLSNKVSSAANVEYHARIISQKYIQRELIKVSTIVMNDCFEDTKDVFDIIGSFEVMLMDVNKQVDRGRIKSNWEIMKSVEEGRIAPSGFYLTDNEDFNKLLGRAERGELITLAGRPGMGKSLIGSTEIPIHVGITLKKKVLIWSLEMPSEQVWIRIMCALSSLTYQEVKYGNLSQEQRQRYDVAAMQIIESGIKIVDTVGVTMTDIRALAHQMKMTEGLDMIALDYGMLLENMGRDDYRLEIGKSTRMMKRVAKELEVPFLNLWPLPKDVDKRPDKRPRLADLMESASVEADSDIVIFVWAPENYHLTEVQVNGKAIDTKDTIVFIKEKHRQGKVGCTHTAIEWPHFRLRALSGKERAQEAGFEVEPEQLPF